MLITGEIWGCGGGDMGTLCTICSNLEIKANRVKISQKQEKQKKEKKNKKKLLHLEGRNKT